MNVFTSTELASKTKTVCATVREGWLRLCKSTTARSTA